MKKLLTVTTLLLVFALALSACGSPGELLQPQAEPQIREMLTALTAGDAETAAALLHPERGDDTTDGAIAAMADLLGGREVESCLQTGVNMRSQLGGTGGAYREESGSVLITLTDGTELQMNYTYLSDGAGEGFTTFRLAVGV